MASLSFIMNVDICDDIDGSGDELWPNVIAGDAVGGIFDFLYKAPLNRNQVTKLAVVLSS